MENCVFVASCPICGRVLFKGSPNSYVEGGCPKCGEYVRISFLDNGVHALTGKLVKDGGTVRRGAATT